MDASSHRAVPQHGEPARAPASAPRAPQAAPAARVVVRRERRPQRPPMAEVEALWKHAHPLEPGAEPEALTRFYQRHQITGANVLPWKLACTLPLGEPLPPWLPEPRGVPLALSLFDERGRRRGLWPVAARRQPEGFNLRGLVAANPCGWVLLLGEDPVGWRWNGRVVVATTLLAAFVLHLLQALGPAPDGAPVDAQLLGEPIHGYFLVRGGLDQAHQLHDEGGRPVFACGGHGPSSAHVDRTVQQAV